MLTSPKTFVPGVATITISSIPEETVNLVPLTNPAINPSTVASTVTPSGRVTINCPDSFVIAVVENPSQSKVMTVSAPMTFPSSGLNVAEEFSS